MLAFTLLSEPVMSNLSDFCSTNDPRFFYEISMILDSPQSLPGVDTE